jgi:hypothetical protein
MAIRAVLLTWAVCLAAAIPSAHASFSPHPFEDDLGGALAADDEHVWLVIVGQKRDRPAAARIYERGEGRWTRITGPAPRPSARGGPLLAAPPVGGRFAGPCVAYSFGGAEVFCREGSRWRRLPLGGAARPADELIDLKLIDGRLVCLLLGRGTLRVLRFDGGRWSALGPDIAIEGQAIAALGDGVRTPAALVDVGVESFGSTQRSIWSFDGRSWSQSEALGGIVEGPQVSGPVRLADSAYVPVVEAEGPRWPFSVFEHTTEGWSVAGGKPLSAAQTFAQGGISYAAGAMWAAWQENSRFRDGLFRTAIFAARYDAGAGAFDAPITLWRGRSIGPGPVDVVESGESLYAIFARGTRNPREGLRVTVERIGR